MSAPAWYPNPDGTQALRWWDGVQWTGHAHPIEDGLTLREKPGRMERWAERARTEVSFVRATYLGGLSQVRGKKTGGLYFQAEYAGLGAFKPKTVMISNNMITSVEVVGGEAARRKVAAVAAFGVLGGLAAKGAEAQTVVIVRMTDAEEAYFELDKISPQEVRAKLSSWMAQHGIPWRNDQVSAERNRATPIGSVADELQKLAALHQSGVLSAEEFQAAKTCLIG